MQSSECPYCKIVCLPRRRRPATVAAATVMNSNYLDEIREMTTNRYTYEAIDHA